MEKGKIIILRHGESEEDVNNNVKSLPDDPSGLTPKGILMVKEKSKDLMREYMNYEKYFMYSSPSHRAQESMKIFMENNQLLSGQDVIIVPAIRNLNWGNTTIDNVTQIESDRYKAGVLNYHFPGGDDTKVYVKAIQEFCKELMDVFTKQLNSCVTIFTHGFALRVIVKEVLQLSKDTFRYLANPKNCYSCVIDVSLELNEIVFSLREPLQKITFSID